MSEKYIRQCLLDLQDTEYKKFQANLMPTVDENLIIGVRTPKLRQLAKEISKTEYMNEFLEILPHKYYEENNLHAFLIESIKDYGLCIDELNRFLPYVDNWATCDMMRPKIFKRYRSELLSQIRIWIKSDDVYTVRFAVNMLMCHFLDEDFNAKYLEMAADIISDEYYIKMVVAWYFATALAKQWDATLPFILNERLDKDTHNKTIRKAIESYRITNEQKAYLRKLKI